jgi:hypothetical protein
MAVPYICLTSLFTISALSLPSHSVGEDKTNEAGCLKQHVKEFFEKYPFVQLLTGDAIFAGRPLLKVLADLDKDYLFCVKDNQETILESLVQAFADVDWNDPSTIHKVEKKEAA